ncbi:hypothetical protein M422DRAFT_23583 [Sphaerobolus stellatus SS14]|nr:hypothetical protein M422DRAFT_23583 [Sphaerobolus stellatus SS14]
MLGNVGNGWINPSPVEVLVQRACDPIQHEANYAVHLELAEHINTKKANTPRDAAMAIVRMVNHRNPHISLLALTLLDTLVENCGYPFHLQIATKEFLNELVRRFPERPPPFPGPVMTRILQTLHSWKEGICVTSRWKEDLGNIRDMHRLLSFKGYRFRDLPRTNTAAVSTANEVGELKSAEELEKEDHDAQAAKLQELIRRGTPRDLAAAQELMKIMAGANPDAKPDYRAQALKELNKLESKVVLLDEMLDNVDVGRKEKYAEGDVYDQVAASLIAARPKLQKWISDAESEDSESLATFLQMNDQINNVLNRLDAFKAGDYSAMANAVPTNLAGSSSAAPKNDLIDLIDEPVPTQTSSTNPVDDLADIFGGPSTTTATTSTSHSLFFNNNNSHNGAGAPPSFSGGFIPATGGIVLSTTPQPRAQPQQPAQQFPFQSSQSSQPFRSVVSSQQTSQPQQPQSQPQKQDPFADLAGLF